MNDFNAHQVGVFGEKQCAKYAKKVKKLKILGKNVKIGKLEADIIATNKDYIIFIEVKTRRQDKCNAHRPGSAVDRDKRSNLINFAYAYCKSLPKKHQGKTPRIDVCELLVVADKKLKVCELNYIENAVSR